MTVVILAIITLIIIVIFCAVSVRSKLPGWFILTGFVLPLISFLYCWIIIKIDGSGGGDLDILLVWFISLPVQFLVSLIVAFAIRAVSRASR
jgi:hypothetical protein